MRLHLVNGTSVGNHHRIHTGLVQIFTGDGKGKTTAALGTVLRAVVGFTGRGQVETTSLVDAGGKLPLVIEFVDDPDKVDRIVPLLKEMVGKRLIIRQRVEVESDNPVA
ncbi:MAG: DUF190 domain-containing protein [Pedosphaera parvula]|nr:DUF190 domain-containing protein [Pedosphaera parvula]